MTLHGFARALIVGSLGLIAAFASSAALAATVREGRLDIRGLDRGANRQSIALRARLDPPPSKRAVIAATLTIGETVVPVRAIVGRTGLLAVRASHLDLGTMLPDFGTAVLDLPAPIAAHVAFLAQACVPAVRGHQLACPASVGVQAPAADGVYDATLTIDGSASAAVATVATAQDGHRNLQVVRSIFDALWLSGPADGSLTVLTGYAIGGGDILSNASGSALSTHDSAGSRVEGSALTAFFGTASTWSFVLQRPDAGTPTDDDGREWLVTFDGSGLSPLAGDVAFDLAVPADGHATTAPTTLVSDGTALLELDAGSCLVTPSWRIWCRLPSSEMYGIVMSGAFDRAAGTGSGSFYLGSPPSIFAEGSWSAVRMVSMVSPRRAVRNGIE